MSETPPTSPPDSGASDVDSTDELLRQAARAPGVAPPSDLVGTTLGRYRIRALLGRGGMGVVYEAEDPGLQRSVALKVLRGESLGDAARRARFLREARLAAAVTGPELVPIYEVGEAGSQIYLAMELVRGSTLRALMKPPLPLARVLALAGGVARGLARAHRAGIVHRDLKPENVLVDGDGADAAPRLTDFGLARLDDSTPVSGDAATAQLETRAGQLVGTPAYMSPEQARGRPVDAKTDVFSFGVLLYELLTGARPFSGGTPMELVIAIDRDEAPPASTKNAAVPPWLDALLARCLSKQPAGRPTAAECATELGQQVSGSASGASGSASQGASVAASASPAPASPASPPVSADSRRRRIGAAVAIAALLLLSAGGVAMVLRRRGSAASSAKGAHAGNLARDGGRAGPASVAVLGFRNLAKVTDADWISTALAEMLRTELAQSGSLRAVPSETLADLMRDLGAKASGSLGGETLGRLRKATGTDFVATGSYLVSSADDSVRVDIQLQDAASGETRLATSLSGQRAALPELVARAGAALRQSLGVAVLDARQVDEVRRSMPGTATAQRLYSEAIVLMRDFLCMDARDRLERAIAEDPRHGPARALLARALSCLSYDAKAAEEAARAAQLTEGLRLEDRLAIELIDHRTHQRWDKGLEAAQKLIDIAPDNLEYLYELRLLAGYARKYDLAVAAIAVARKAPPPTGDDPRLDIWEGELDCVQGKLEQGVAMMTRGIQHANALGRSYLATLGEMYRAPFLIQLGRLDEAKVALEKARVGAAAVGDRDIVVAALTTLEQLHESTGHLNDAARSGAEAVAMARELGSVSRLSSALLSMGFLNMWLGEIGKARTLFEELLTVAQANNIEIFALIARFGIAYANAPQGHQREVVAALLKLPPVAGPGTAHLLMGESRLALGEFEAAETELSAAVEGLAAQGKKPDERMARWLQAALRWNLGKLDEAATLLADLRKLDVELKRPDQIAMVDCRRAAIAVQQGKLDDARKLQPACAQAIGPLNESFIGRFVSSLDDAWVSGMLGGEPERAAALQRLETLATEARGRSFLNLELDARSSAGKLELLRGSPPAGRKRLQAVEREARRLGFGRIVAVAQRALAAPRTP